MCVFVEVLQECIGSKKYQSWPLILIRFVRHTASFELLTENNKLTDEWELILQNHRINKSDEYAGLLASIEWTESDDRSMHNYFQEILDICFDEGRQQDDLGFLDVSEDIILLLQKMAVNVTII